MQSSGGVRPVAVLSLALAVLAAACGGGGTGGGDTDDGSGLDETTSVTTDGPGIDETTAVVTEAAPADDADAPATDEGDPAGPAAVVEPGDWIAFDLFRTLPADGETLIGLTFADLERAGSAIGATRPAPEDQEAFLDWNRRVNGFILDDGPPQAFALAPPFREDVDPLGWAQAFGFSILDTDAVVEAGSPPGTVTSFAVSVTDEAIDAAVTNDPVWSSDLEVRQASDGPYYQWSAEAEIEPDRIGPGRPLGRGGLLAVRDGIAIRGITGEEFLASLEAWAEGPSLADIPAVAELLHALDGVGTHSFAVVDGIGGPLPDLLTAESIDDLRDQLEEDLESAQLVPFVFAAAGVTVIDEQPLDVVAYVHDSPESAVANEERIRTLIETGRSTVNDIAWSEVYRVRSVASRGSVSVAVLEPINGLPTRAVSAAFQRDSLFWFGG